ncbi:hypothetical protein AgCh_006820 [Apium graveolens]
MVPKLKSQRSAQASNRPLRSASCHATSRTAPNRQPNKQIVRCRDLNPNMLIFEEGGLLDGTEVTYFDDGKPLLKGYKAGSEIFCYCCFTKTSPSGFEKHAFLKSGMNLHKKPYSYIQLENGLSLHKAALYLREVRSNIANGNSSADGEKGLLCDDCCSFFHKDSASFLMNSPAKYQCGFCRKECIEQKSYASEHPIMKTDECATCAVAKNEKPTIVCALAMCSGYKRCDCVFGPLALITCAQCEKEFHVGCLKEHGNSNLKEKPKGKWFCSFDCKNIFSTLENFIRDYREENFRCRLLCAKSIYNNDKLLLDATSIFYESFGMIKTSESDDLLRDMVYSHRKTQNRRMYCAVVKVGSTVVAAALFRVLGQDFAELPFAATAMENRRKGYLGELMSYLEDLLTRLNVRKLVLPSAKESKDMWKRKFSFEDMSKEQRDEFQKICWDVVTFEDATMLHKVIPKKSEDKQNSDREQGCKNV